MEKLAIVGTGIAGMGAAWLLHKNYDITVFEKNNYIGGHTNTIILPENEKQVFIDTGFMVFNKVTYPLLTRLFETLEVPIMKTDMSFSVQHCVSGLEYNGSGLDGLFSQRKNIFNPGFISMLWQINRFNTQSLELLDDEDADNISLAEYIAKRGYSKKFLYQYLIPMSSAVWSTPPDLMLNFPARTLVRFFFNHGFLGLNTQHQWYTVVNGSQAYREKLIKPFQQNIITNNPVRSIKRLNGQIQILLADGSQSWFDKIIVAAHADEALQLLADPTPLEQNTLSCFSYQENIATLHTDSSVMPRLHRVWSSWNYRIENSAGQEKTSTIYYMNKLQNVSQSTDYFVSINDPGNIARDKTIKTIQYHHPLFDVKALQAQKALPEINNQHNNTYFCGSYFRYGFHEDAFMSAVHLCRQLVQDLPW